MEKPLPLQINYKELSLVILISLLISSNADADSDSLKSEFYIRLHIKFYDRCHKAASKTYRGIPDWELIRDEVFHETFEIALRDIGKFELKNYWDEAECEKVMLFWMSGIANNLFLNYARNGKKEKDFLDDYTEYLKAEDCDEDQGSKPDKRMFDKEKFDEMWGKLNPMSKEILLLCAGNGTLRNENTNHLPDEIINHITTKYGVKPPAIRKAKQRALEQLRKCKI